MELATLFRTPLKLARTAESAPPRPGWPVSGATPEHLAAINRRPEVLRELTAEDVFVRSMDAINDLPLKNGMRIETPGVFAIAGMARGAPVLCNHDTGILSGPPGLPVGRVFAARARTREVGTWGELDFWMTATDDKADLVARMDAGEISEVSVSFGYGALLCTICDSNIEKCAHWPGEVYGGKTCEGLYIGVNEFYEVSLVWQGMANGTRLKMAASRFDASADLITAFPNKPRPHALQDLFAGPVNQDALRGLFTK